MDVELEQLFSKVSQILFNEERVRNVVLNLGYSDDEIMTEIEFVRQQGRHMSQAAKLLLRQWCKSCPDSTESKLQRIEQVGHFIAFFGLDVHVPGSKNCFSKKVLPLANETKLKICVCRLSRKLVMDGTSSKVILLFFLKVFV